MVRVQNGLVDDMQCKCIQYYEDQCPQVREYVWNTQPKCIYHTSRGHRHQCKYNNIATKISKW